MLSHKLVKAVVWSPRGAFGPIRALSITPVKNDGHHTVDDFPTPWRSTKPQGKPNLEAEIFTNEKGAERDHVNFPRRKRPLEVAPVRHLIFPEGWFQAFHSKTGVTGPYMFAASFSTYLLSKEIWILDHEFYVSLSVFSILGLFAYNYGASVRAYTRKEADAYDDSLKSIRNDEIQRCKDAIAAEEHEQFMASSYEELIKAKKENVGLQLETEYRTRLQTAYQQVKNRLDYQLELTNVMRRTEQKHMVNWIVDNVRKSITPKQEEEALKKCVADLKALAK